MLKMQKKILGKCVNSLECCKISQKRKLTILQKAVHFSVRVVAAVKLRNRLNDRFTDQHVRAPEEAESTRGGFRHVRTTGAPQKGAPTRGPAKFCNIATCQK